MSSTPSKPIVLAIGGHDPSGGAGLQADIETLAAHDCHTLSLVTALTTQNTCRVSNISPQSSQQLEMQFRLLLDESEVQAIKIGMLGSSAIAQTLARLLAEHAKIPTVLDPVLASGSGSGLGDEDLPGTITQELLPHCTLITPNSQEARRLGGQQDLADCAQTLIGHGCASVLITGAHEPEDAVVNRLYGLGGLIGSWEWPRLEHSYHGSGCTLTSAIAANLAQGYNLKRSVAQAQAYTWNSLKQGYSSGRCQLTPNRLHAR